MWGRRNLLSRDERISEIQNNEKFRKNLGFKNYGKLQGYGKRELSNGIVSFHMKREMVGTGEGAFAQRALEGLVAGVFAVVPCELVTSCEFPAAVVPATAVGLFATVRAHMRLKMRALRVLLRALWMRTLVKSQTTTACRWRARSCASTSGRRGRGGRCRIAGRFRIPRRLTAAGFSDPRAFGGHVVVERHWRLFVVHGRFLLRR